MCNYCSDGCNMSLTQSFGLTHGEFDVVTRGDSQLLTTDDEAKPLFQGVVDKARPVQTVR